MKPASVHKLLMLLWVATFCYLFPFIASSQCITERQFYDKILSIKNDEDLSASNKLKQFLDLKQIVDGCHLPQDSTYALLLHRLGVSCYAVQKYNEAISYTLSSARINTSGKNGSNPRFAVTSYMNVGLYFRKVSRYKDAITYFDSCTLTGNNFKDSVTLVYSTNARGLKANLYNKTGDYQKVIEEAAIGLRTASSIHDSTIAVTLLNEQASAYAKLHRFEEAVAALDKAANLMVKNDLHNGADNYKARAAISTVAGHYAEAIVYHKKAIAVRLKTHDTTTLAGDYLDAGNTKREEAISKNAKDFSETINYYTQALQLAQKSKSFEMQRMAINNLAAIAFREEKYTPALNGYHKTLQQLVTSFKNDNALNYPTHRQCHAVSDKNFLSLVLANKAECLLHLYKQTGNKDYLTASLNTAMLTDSVITDMRHEQAGDQSKLYWRENTRWFFLNAIEACYAANNPSLALYFMEKSRAVMLNDKLAELGASAHLPAAEAAEEQRLQIDVFSQQQKLASLSDSDPTYKDEEVKLFKAREDLQRYLATLQTTFPAYYQYKYADAVPLLPQLQQYLAANHQSFVDYFISDTAVYTLAVTPSSASLQKQKRDHLNNELSGFLQTCSDPQLLNSQYPVFAAQAHALYQCLFQSLALPKGRVVVCNDGLLIPFEALTTDAEGAHFLINDYSFSYVYSAQSLLKKFSNPFGDGDFFGIAPVTYAANLSVPPLQEAGKSLLASSAFFNRHTLLFNAEANRYNLLTYLPRYTVVTILSHARADSTGKEPILYMADSIIRLSELQLLRHPSTELVVLSACQTNVGKMATGEGVFSLTRGFASAGIPSITATLWKADEEAIYAITQGFLKNIAAGMQKDEALRQAKLSYMQSGSGKARLPFYWANMILAGNSEPVTLSHGLNKLWWIAGSGLLVLLTVLFLVARRRK